MKNKFNLKDICLNAGADNFVGINFEGDSKKVIFPIGYEIPSDDNECRLSILNLLKLVSLSRSSLFENKYGIKDGEEKELPINSYLWIINDYLTNGVYFDIEKKYVQNQNGKINWKKTLSSKFYVSNNSVIYLNPFVEKKTTEKNYITDIHLFCINKSLSEIGWIFGNIESPKSGINVSNLTYYKNILSKELIKTFDDRKKRLIMHMKRILDNTTDENSVYGEKKYGTNQFEYIWEYMIDDVFGNEKVSNFFPGASWSILDWNKSNDSKLRPDTILSDDDKLYILDSKYYKFGISGNLVDLPHTESIQKQITYGEYANNKQKFSKIFNAFIVPYNKANNVFNINKNIEYIGFAESNWKDNKNKLHEHIALILIDTKYIIDSYFQCTKNDTKLLTTSINKIIDTFKNY